jgi:hypothetical protein
MSEDDGEQHAVDTQYAEPSDESDPQRIRIDERSECEAEYENCRPS